MCMYMIYKEFQVFWFHPLLGGTQFIFLIKKPLFFKLYQSGLLSILSGFSIDSEHLNN